MKVEVPFTYSIQYVPNRKRSVQSVFGRGSVGVRIRKVVGPADLAFEVGTVFRDHAQHSPFECRDGNPVKVYAAEDAFWVEICGAEEAADLISKRSTFVRDPFNVTLGDGERSRCYLGMAGDRDEPDKTRAELEKEHGGLRRWDESNHDWMATLIQRRASEDLRMIEGSLCMRVTEPCLAFHRHFPFEYGSNGQVEHERNDPRNLDPKACYLIVDQVRNITPAGFRLNDTVPAGTVERFRIDAKDAALAYGRMELLAEAKEKTASARRVGGAFEGAAIAAEPLIDAAVIGKISPHLCAFDGEADLLLDRIEALDRVLREDLAKLDARMLPPALDLRLALERDGRRLTPDTLTAARRLRDEAGQGPIWMRRVGLPHGTLSDNGYAHCYGQRDADVAFAGALAKFDLALGIWERRSRTEREWLDQGLAVSVVRSEEADVVEVLTADHVRRIVEAGCDPALAASFAEASRGEVHVLSVESPDGIPTGFAATVRVTDGAASIERVFGPELASPKAREAAERGFVRFAAETTAHIRENSALEAFAL